MISDENNSCPCGDRLGLAGPHPNRSGDTFLAGMESHMGMTFSRKAALVIGVAYIAAAISVAARLRNSSDIVVFLVLYTAGKFLLIIRLVGESK